MKRSICMAALLLLLIAALLGCQRADGKTLTDFSHAQIGVQTGTSHDKTIGQMFPEAERVYFNNGAEIIMAVEQGKIDCYAEDEPYYIAALWEGASIVRAEVPFDTVSNAFAFPKEGYDATLVEQVDAFIRSAREDGTIERLRDKWLSPTEPTEHPDYMSLEGVNGTLHIATVAQNKPISYLKGDRFTGFEIELITLFAQQHGYALDFESLPFESVIMGLAAGKYDMACAGLNITEERRESVRFSESYTDFDAVFIVKAPSEQNRIESVDDLEHATIAMITGTAYAPMITERFPHAKQVFFSSYADIYIAMQQGRADLYMEDHIVYTSMCWEKLHVRRLDEVLMTGKTAMILPKQAAGSELETQLNGFITRCRDDGTLAALEQKWLGESEPTEHPDHLSLRGENGELRVAVGVAIRPMTYQKNGVYTGYEIELLTMFAQEYGYSLRFEAMPFESIITAMTGDKYDLAAACFIITEERAKSVLFTESYMEMQGIVILPDEQVQSVGTLWDSIADGFEKTFVREDRWKQILGGVRITLIISICSMLGGTALGLALYMLSRAENRLVRGISRAVARVYSRIIAGTPVVVILMILFYVVFGNVRNMNGILVAVIGFSLTFGAFVYDHMHVSVDSVDFGQTEAAYALGYTKGRTFFRIILPQAMRIFLPTYCSETVSLVKATAVVGYVAVNDLTRVGDIIRSNTYEAVFPLLTTAVLYFLLTWLFAALLGRLKYVTDPDRRSKEKILKGVKVK